MEPITLITAPTAASASAPTCGWCSYSLVGLDPAGDCPECGRPLAPSLEGAQPGSPWQCGQPRAWRRTTWATLRHPRRSAARLRLARPSGWGLLAINAIATSTAILGLSFAVLTLHSWIAHGHLEIDAGESLPLVLVIGIIACAIAAACLLTMLCVYIRARLGRWDRSWTLARVVCCHATPVWLIAGAIIPLGLVVGDLGMQLGWWAQGFLGALVMLDGWYTFCLYFALPGTLLAYIAFVIIGVRSCRRAALAPTPT